MREKLFAIKHKAATALAVVPAMLALSMTSFAAVDASTDISTALSAGLNDVVTQMITMIATLLPSALTVMGAMLVVKKGIAMFKQVSGKQ